ncbi:MAG TPA: hypothetical protein VHW23_28065, partial [Kofleriaceae bacterium]|nr:hypothetical protein [Kofleriaceae bacterium]
MADWVHAAERAYVAAAVGRTAGAVAIVGAGEAEPARPRLLLRSDWGADLPAADRRAHAIAAAGAVASRYLA